MEIFKILNFLNYSFGNHSGDTKEYATLFTVATYGTGSAPDSTAEDSAVGNQQQSSSGGSTRSS